MWLPCHWPLHDELRGDAGQHDGPPSTAARPDELGIATAIERFQRATTVMVERVRHAWAGLRTFAADADPVIGLDGDTDGFMWLAGQGGLGITTSPALSRIGASVILGRPFPADLAALGLTAAVLAPQRLRS